MALHQNGTREVDNSVWDGNAALSHCSQSSSPAVCFRAICAGKKEGDPKLRETWALPHHKMPGGPPNAAGVRNARARFSLTEGLTNAAEARSHLEAHMKAIQGQSSKSQPPRDSLYRAAYPAIGIRQEDDQRNRELYGHFAVFDEWAEINSVFEGHFMERIAPGAFKKTFKENRNNIRVLFQHGRDAQVGDKPLGPIEELLEDDHGARYVVSMLDTSYNRDLIPGLEAGLYGSSFRMRVTREDFRRMGVESSDYNPNALPERTIKEIHLSEFGPVTFPAYKNATAGVRSITDEILMAAYAAEPERVRELLRGIDPEALDKLASKRRSDEVIDYASVIYKADGTRRPLHLN